MRGEDECHEAWMLKLGLFFLFYVIIMEAQRRLMNPRSSLTVLPVITVTLSMRWGDTQKHIMGHIKMLRLKKRNLPHRQTSSLICPLERSKMLQTQHRHVIFMANQLANSRLFTHQQTQSNLSSNVESGDMPPSERKSNIQFPFSSFLVYRNPWDKYRSLKLLNAPQARSPQHCVIIVLGSPQCNVAPAK